MSEHKLEMHVNEIKVNCVYFAEILLSEIIESFPYGKYLSA